MHASSSALPDSRRVLHFTSSGATAVTSGKPEQEDRRPGTFPLCSQCRALGSLDRAGRSSCAACDVGQLADPLGLWKCPRSLARRPSQESASATNFQLAKTQDKDDRPSERPGTSTPIGICNSQEPAGEGLAELPGSCCR